ncbi:MAG: hypothetical protein HZB51_30620 [Chloroflexi bacterium]|nr:hypothetical protein [Chloroflexota bacterium]
MTRTTTLVFVFFTAILVFTVGILIVRDQTIPDNAQVELNKFLQYRNSAQPATVVQVVRATMPSKLTREMSGGSYGDSNFFSTMVDYRHVPNVNLPNLATATPGLTSATFGRGSTPIPFPPEDVWCILLKGDTPAEQIVFVTLHTSLYNADWLVHEPFAEPGSAEMKTILATIGCNLKLGQ